MSDIIATPETAVVVDVTASNGAPAPAQTAATNGPPSDDPKWVADRLAQHRRSILKDLGVESLDQAKKAVEAMRTAEEAEKSASQKALEASQRVERIEAQLRTRDEALGLLAKEQLGTLSDAQRVAVSAVAGDDAALQIKTIAALRPTWTSAAAPAAPAVQTPKDTAPPPSAPKDGGNVSPPDVKAVYAELKKTNPVLAARYAFANGVFDQ